VCKIEVQQDHLVIKLICNHCEEFFEKGTGHTMGCDHCDSFIQICNECYEDAKKMGNVRDPPKTHFWQLGKKEKMR